MNLNDAINGMYEFIGGLFILRNCFKLYEDKEVRGVSIVSSAFFCSWGYWNLYYYPNLNQWYSFIGGLLIALASTLWIVMAIYYVKRKENLKEAVAECKSIRDHALQEAKQSIEKLTGQTLM
jgi:hypothetical protein